MSCNDEAKTIVDEVQDVELLANNVLKFKDQTTFDKYVNERIKIENFYSLADYYLDAMGEAESYYEREGEYEEFKEKYNELYFPEYEDDYSA
jgi:hypothetical protein